MSGGLFDLDAYDIKPVPTPPALNTGERMRARQAAKLAAGEHPLSGVGEKPTRILLAPEGTGTCGTCAHKMRPHHHGRAYPKCAAGAFRDPAGTGFREVWPRAAHSEATDIRSWWPACTSYEPADRTEAAKARVPQRIRRLRVKDWSKGDAVIVDRTSDYGNPWKVGEPGIPDRAAAAAQFELGLALRRIVLATAKDPDEALLLMRLGSNYPSDEQIRRELAGRDLACPCELPDPGGVDHCHARVLLHEANQEVCGDR